MSVINCMIIEDEQPAQKVLVNYIKEIPTLHLAHCLNNAVDAVRLLQHSTIDLIFLDIHLPKISGLNFLRSLRHYPKVIITTAYPQYALEGFELEVMDYLLKPFSFERFLAAINKYPAPMTEKSIQPAEHSALQDFIMIKSGKGFEKIQTDQIYYLKSDTDLVKIFTAEKVHFEFRSLKSYESDLPENFMRVHKSFIVNLNEIRSIDGNRLLVAKEHIPIGRNYKSQLLKKLNIQKDN
ncbi:MAG: LytTR family DNA-binding domain-containing protein [Bacteroidota bacterium]